MSYQPEWSTDESPTKGMSTADMLKYYKANSVRGWCRFYLADPGDMSDTLKNAISELVDACATRETPAHRTRREQLRRIWQAESAARHANGGNHASLQ